jgi:excisionase family DNA binding protein
MRRLNLLSLVSHAPNASCARCLMLHETHDRRICYEFNGQRRVFSLDELAKSFLEAIQTAIRQEVGRVLSSGAIPTPQDAKESEVNRPVALSKAKAAHALGVSVRTIDDCIARHKIRVLRIGRRVLIPMNSIEAALKRGALETHPGNRNPVRRSDPSGIQKI